MKFRAILFLMLFFSFNAFSQVDSINVVSDDVDIVEIELEEQDSNYVDEESSIIELSNESLKNYVGASEDFLSYINILKDRDSLVYHYILINGESNLTPKIDNINVIEIDKKVDVIFHPNSKKVMYVGEMILNENQAWDFIYETIFDQDGLTRMFIRQYSTFNSVCAQVAFERSEYFFNAQNEVIKKTYEIFDANHNPLKIDDCWMEREDYIKYKSFDELNTALKIPLEDSSKEEVKEIEEKQLETEE
jgi:hypothetical protein